MRRWLAMSALLALGCGSGDPPRAPAVSEAVPSDQDPFALLRVGDFEGANAVLDEWRGRADQRDKAIAGQLRVASITRDQSRIQALLGAIPEGAPFPIRMLATAAAMVDARLSPAERALVSGTCPPPPQVAGRGAVEAICAQAKLFEGRDAIMRCEAGCGATQTVPVFHAGLMPVVEVSLAGSAPRPFVIDTGAATSSVTSAVAKELGLEPVSASSVGSSAGRLRAGYVLATVELGGRRIADARMAVVNVAVAGTAGVIAPHDLFRGARSTLDLSTDRLAVGPSREAPAAGMASFPLFYQARRPHLLVEVGGRPPRPLALDSGADRTRLTAELEALGDPLPRTGTTGSASAAGVLPMDRTSATLPAKAGELAFAIVDPLVFTPAGRRAPLDLGSFGLLGIEVMEGRTLAFDLPRRRLEISTAAALGAWPVGAQQTLRVSGRDFPEPVTVTETVKAVEAGRVTLEVAWAEQRLTLDVPDDRVARGSWLVTRPLGDDDATAKREQLAELVTLFTPAGRGSFDVVAEDGARCGRMSLPAKLDHKPAVVRIVSCPGATWPVRRVSLEQSDQIQWQLEQVVPSAGG